LATAKLDAEIDRLYGLPLDEFIAQRDALAKRLRGGGEPEAGAAVKALRKPTAGAWALNQAVRRRRAETDALLATGRRLREAHESLLTGGDPAVLREAMEEERSLTASLADCAEAIASETGKSGPALRDRVRATLHAAAVEDEAREELAAGRFVREREAVGLGTFGAADPDAPPAARPDRRATGGGRRSSTTQARRPAREQRSSGSAERRATRERPAPKRRAPADTAPAESARDAQLEEAERLLAEARAALGAAEADHAATISRAEAAREALDEAEQAEREARRVLRELWREVAKQERRVERRRMP
jgi:hypothetical protein